MQDKLHYFSFDNVTNIKCSTIPVWQLADLVDSKETKLSSLPYNVRMNLIILRV
jgi:hypothetical protein